MDKEFAATAERVTIRLADNPDRTFDCADCSKLSMDERNVRLHYILTGHFTKA